MRHTLLALDTRASSLAMEIASLGDDVNRAPIERKFAIAKELTIKQAALKTVKDDIASLQKEVDGLEIQWNESNVCNKPKTIVLKEN